MKRAGIIILSILTALCVTAGTAFAAGGDAVALTIDNKNLYAGMDRAYSSGYIPAVESGTAKIVLPLVPVQEIKNSSINITADLGDPATSPFVFGNYDKTITLQEYAVNNNTGKAKAYLAELALPLISGRSNGRYPVTINAQGQLKDGAAFAQSFTLYVTVTDGADPNAHPTGGGIQPPDTGGGDSVPPDGGSAGGDMGGASGGGGADEPKPQPRVMISNYSVNPSPVLAGQEFELSITLQNTNDKQPLNNMKVTVSGETADVIPMGETNSFYFKKVKARETVALSTKMKVQETAEPKPQKILLHIEYEGDKAAAFTSDESVIVQVKQPIRIEFDEPEIPKEVNAGDTMSVSFNVMNMGKGTVYNVRAELEAPGLVPEGSLFIGNMESGSSKKGDMYVFIGTLDSEFGGGDNKYGPTGGKITISYEDEYGEVSSQEMDFMTTINPPVINAPQEEEEEKPQTQSQWWISVIILGAVIGGVLGIRYYLKKRKEKKAEDEDS